jgi:hypothetical protein
VIVPSHGAGAVLLVAALVGTLAAGCTGHRRQSTRVTRVSVLRATALDRIGRSCLASFRPEFRLAAATVVVRRVWSAGESLTFTDQGRRTLLGCDRTRGSRGWCGRAAGRLEPAIEDARLDIACRLPDGGPIGFGWIYPAEGVRRVGIRGREATELWPVAGALPVRVTTTTVDLAASSATFRVVELDADGKEVRGYRVRAAVAG